MKISIHAPRTGSDAGRRQRLFLPPHFNPRSPHGERRDANAPLHTQRDFNPRSPHGERLSLELVSCQGVCISIHAPRTGSDPGVPLYCWPFVAFQSTLPARGATSCVLTSLMMTYFNPRSPHGERHGLQGHEICCEIFQSTLPARGATVRWDAKKYRYMRISIHAPRTGSDSIA